MATPLAERKLIFVTGKGGVGRTTVASALALGLADSGKRVLLAELGGSHGCGPLFGIGTTYDYEPVALAKNLWLSHLTPAQCLMEFGAMRLRVRALAEAVFNNPLVSALMGLVPGMEELLVIGKLDHLANLGGKAPDGRPYDLIVVDTPPTGQGLGLLALPRAILSAVSTGPIARDVGRIRSLVEDPDLTGLLLTTTPEELPVDELLEYNAALLAQGLPVAAVVANKCLPVIFQQRELEVLNHCIASARAHQNFSQDYETLSLCVGIHAIQKAQEMQLMRLKQRVAVPVVELPVITSPMNHTSALQRLAVTLSASASKEHP